MARMIEDENSEPLNPTELTDDILKGAVIYGIDNQRIGKVERVAGVDTQRVIAVDVGGFLGIGSKAVGVPAHEIDFRRNLDGMVYAITPWDEDQLKAMPPLKD